MNTESRKLVVLDLDNTLVFTWEHMHHCENFIFDYHFQCEDEKIWGKQRPQLDYFLTELNKIADIAIWSASQKEYIEKILKVILNRDIVPVMILDRTHCNRGDGFGCHLPIATKPLKKIWRKGKYNSKNTLVIDDIPMTYSENHENAIAIKQYNGESDDEELLVLLEKIKKRLLQDDVRIK